MANIKLSSNPSGTGTLTIASPNTNSDYTFSLPASSGTVATLASVTNNGVVYVNSSGQPTSGSGMVFDGSNLGLGVTPSAWSGSGAKAFEIGTWSGLSDGGAYGTVLTFNGRYNSGWFYKATNAAAKYEQDGSHRWYTAPSGTAGNAISFTQALTLNANGALVLQGGNTSASGVGVAFPATQNASSDANTLDDYEEGSWTPAFVSDGGTTGTTTVTARWGRYVKIGRQVTVNFGWTGSLSGFTGVLQVAGLPFAVVSETTYQFGGGFECTSSTATGSDGSNFVFFAFSSSLYPRFTTGQTGGYLFNGSSQINGLTGIQGTMTYNTTT